MTLKDLLEIQIKNYGFSAPFEMPIIRIMSDEIIESKFFTPAGYKLDIKTKPCLESGVRKHGFVYMLSKLFGKETLYKIGGGHYGF